MNEKIDIYTFPNKRGKGVVAIAKLINNGRAITIEREHIVYIFMSKKKIEIKSNLSFIKVVDTQSKLIKIYSCFIKNKKTIQESHIPDIKTFISQIDATADELILLKLLVEKEKTKFDIVKKDMDYILKKVKQRVKQ